MKEKAENIYDTLVPGDNTLVYTELTQLVSNNQKTLLYTDPHEEENIISLTTPSHLEH